MSNNYNRIILTGLMKEENDTMKQEFTSASTSINKNGLKCVNK